jgi:molybdate transport system substrate-binding protein
MLKFFVFYLILLIIIPVCFSEEIMILSAASLTDGLKHAVSEFNKTNPEAKFSINFSSSGALRNQIENGAPADIFLSADWKHIEKLIENNTIPSDNVFQWISNDLVVITPLNSTISNIKDLITIKGKISIGKPNIVPVGTYAKESLQKLDIYSKIEDKLVLANTTRQVASYVLSENCVAGIVYSSDYHIFKNKVKQLLELPHNSYREIIYGIGIINPQKKFVNNFTLFLLSKKGKEIFKKYGFSSR